MSKLNKIFAAAQQTSAAELPSLFQRFQIEVHAVKVNEPKIMIENAFNWDNFGIEHNRKPDNDKNFTLNIFADSWPVL